MSAPITVGEYERAEREVTRAEARRGFRIHATAYVLVNLLLAAINLIVVTQTSEDAIWFVFPLLCWGVGLTMHYVFGVRRLEANITERQARIEQRALGT
jgi:uncharacterized membrane protein YdbT with pleckstrin-like domain